MFKFRIIGFILLMALLGGIFFWEAGGVWLFAAAAPALVGTAVGECCSMLNRSGRPALVMPAAMIVWLIALGVVLGFKMPVAFYTVSLLAAMLVIAGCGSLLNMNSDTLERVFNTAGVIILLMPPLVLLLCSYFVRPWGFWLMYLCLVTKATDTGGYIVGTLTAKLPGGNHKIAPKVSPKKSYEGLAGGLILSLTVSWAFYRFGGTQVDLSWFMISAVVLSFGSFFGDLTESAIKRICEIKDSGAFVPGMGGAFDVLDSFIYNGLLFWPLYFMKDIL